MIGERELRTIGAAVTNAVNVAIVVACRSLISGFFGGSGHASSLLTFESFILSISPECVSSGFKVMLLSEL